MQSYSDSTLFGVGGREGDSTGLRRVAISYCLLRGLGKIKSKSEKKDGMFDVMLPLQGGMYLLWLFYPAC